MRLQYYADHGTFLCSGTLHDVTYRPGDPTGRAKEFVDAEIQDAAGKFQ